MIKSSATLSNNDLEFLAKQTSLSRDRLELLIEDDLDLLLENISDVVDQQILVISFPLYTKITVYKTAKKLDASLPEKVFVADSISEIYPKVHMMPHYTFLNSKTDPVDLARMHLVLIGLFEEMLRSKTNRHGAPDITFYANHAKSAFERADIYELSANFDNWIEILHELRQKHFKL